MCSNIKCGEFALYTLVKRTHDRGRDDSQFTILYADIAKVGGTQSVTGFMNRQGWQIEQIGAI